MQSLVRQNNHILRQTTNYISRNKNIFAGLNDPITLNAGWLMRIKTHQMIWGDQAKKKGDPS